MLIHIVHDKRTITARVIYNFRQFSDIILLKLDQPIADNEKTIILDFKNKEWRDDASIKEKLPEVFEQILFKLRNIINEALR